MGREPFGFNWHPSTGQPNRTERTLIVREYDLAGMAAEAGEGAPGSAATLQGEGIVGG